MPREHPADPGTLPLHAALHQGTEREHQQDLLDPGDPDPSLRPDQAPTAAGRTWNLGTEMRDLKQGAKVTLTMAPLQRKREDNPQSFF